jgi:hypothetical protein
MTILSEWRLGGGAVFVVSNNGSAACMVQEGYGLSLLVGVVVVRQEASVFLAKSKRRVVDTQLTM